MTSLDTAKYQLLPPLRNTPVCLWPRSGAIPINSVRRGGRRHIRNILRKSQLNWIPILVVKSLTESESANVVEHLSTGFGDAQRLTAP